jgi:hypothetical protein
VANSNKILPNLSQGNAIAAGFAAPPEFDTLVLCAEELQSGSTAFSLLRPITGERRFRIIDAGFDDSPDHGLTPHEAWIAENAASRVVRELAAGRKVLVTCMAGRNRSGLVSALVLKRMGWTARDAIRAVRDARENALTNESFVRYLRGPRVR